MYVVFSGLNYVAITVGCTFSICGLEKFDFVVLSSAYKSLTRFALRQKFHVDSIVFLNRCKVFSRHVTLLENKL